MRPASDMKPNQIQAVKDVLRLKTVCNTGDCGFGKSVIGLSTLLAIKKRKPDARALVVSTAKGAKNTWRREHKEWEHTRHLRIKVFEGSKIARYRIFDKKFDMLALSYNSMQSLREMTTLKFKKVYPKRNALPVDFYVRSTGTRAHRRLLFKSLTAIPNIRAAMHFDLVIGDECSALKGHGSAWRDDMIWLSRFSTWRFGLTATPKPRNEDDYWGIALWLDKGATLGEDITTFRARFMISYSLPKGGVVWKMRSKQGDVVRELVAPLFVDYELHKGAVIPIKSQIVKASFSPAAKAKYDELECEQSMYSFTGMPGDKTSTLDAVQTSAKLNQLASGFLYMDENLRILPETLLKYTPVELKAILKAKKRIVLKIFNDRIMALKKLIAGIYAKHGKQNICICYTFKEELEQLKHLCPTGISDVDKDVERKWNTGRVPFLFLQYTRSAMSLNLQGGGFIMISYSPTWRWADDYQIVRRLARQGQKASVVYLYKLMIKGTVDELKAETIEERFKGHKLFQKMIRSKHSV